MATRKGGNGEGTIRALVRCQGRVDDPAMGTSRACGHRFTLDREHRKCARCGTAVTMPDRWEARFSFHERGVRRQRSIYGKTRKEVTIALRGALAKVDRGAAIPADRRQTVADFLTRWLADEQGSVRPSTWRTYSGYIKNHLIPRLGHFRLVELGPQQINAFLTAARSDGGKLSDGTRHHLRAILRAALEDALRWGLVERNAAKLSSSVKVRRTELDAMTPQEAQAILAAVAGSDLEGPIAVALFASLRQGEVLGLRLKDVDLERAVLHVRQTLQRVDGQSTFGEPKSRQSRRDVPMAPALVAIARERRAQEKEKRIRLGLGRAVPDTLFFTNALGESIEPTGLTQKFRALLVGAGLPARTYHQLRHGCASLLLASGTDIKVISSILGHSTITLTADTYAGVVDALKVTATDNLGRLFGSGE